MYHNINNAIRQVDPDHLIFFAGVTWDDFGVGFNSTPGGAQWNNKSVLAYHFYMPPQISLNGTFAWRMRDIERLKCGGFLTEFDTDNEPRGAETMNKCDELLQSWAQWQYKSYVPITGEGHGFYNKDGTIDNVKLRLLSRTYAHAVAGRTISSQFNPTTRGYRLAYSLQTGVAARGPTDIYVNEALQYPNGFAVTVASSPARPTKWVMGAKKPRARAVGQYCT